MWGVRVAWTVVACGVVCAVQEQSGGEEGTDEAGSNRKALVAAKTVLERLATLYQSNPFILDGERARAGRS